MSFVASADFNSSIRRDISSAVSRTANDIRIHLSLVKAHNDESVFLGWRASLKNQIADIADECGSQDWDGEGAFPISKSSRALAERFVTFIPDSVSIPSITPDNSGGYSFDWIQDRDIILSVSLIDDRAIYAGIFGTEKLHGEVNIQDEMPEQIFTILERFFRRA